MGQCRLISTAGNSLEFLSYFDRDRPRLTGCFSGKPRSIDDLSDFSRGRIYLASLLSITAINEPI